MTVGSAETSGRSGDTALSSVAVRDRAPAHHWWVPVVALAAFSFLLHFLWEMLQVPLYADMASIAHWSGVVVCAKAAAGDVAIALTAYAAVAMIGRTWHWHASRTHIAVYLAVGMAITVVLEGLNVYVWHRWAYAMPVPLVLGIGVSPLLQWLVIPPIALWLMQRHVAGSIRLADHTPAVPAPSRSPTRN